MALPKVARIDSPRLRLRPVAAADLPDLLEVSGDPEVTRFLPYETWQSLRDAEAGLARMEAMAALSEAQIGAAEPFADATLDELETAEGVHPETAVAVAAATAFRIQQSSEVLDPGTAFGIAGQGFIEGAKTVPGPAAS